jgi:hypothetical protein
MPASSHGEREHTFPRKTHIHKDCQYTFKLLIYKWDGWAPHSLCKGSFVVFSMLRLGVIPRKVPQQHRAFASVPCTSKIYFSKPLLILVSAPTWEFAYKAIVSQ